MNITQDWLETCGDASLEGALYEAGIRTPQKVTLRFQRLPINEKGPGLVIVPDYVPASLLVSVLSLLAEGYEFEIETYFDGRR